MDNFTLTVIVADLFVVLAIVALMALDKGTPPAPVAAPKTAGKKSV